MHGMGVQAVLTVVLILFTATVKTQKGEISVWKTKVTLTCPEIGKWYKDDTVITEKTDDADLEIEEKSHTFTYEGKTTFHCEYTSEDDKPTKYYFRFEGKVCEDCYEVDARLIGLVIIVDIVGTALLMILICSCTQNKSSAGPAHSSKGTNTLEC
uniref:T-cell surface glycoprotein CD3 epsilon chain-like n=1 Tax=Acanthochromis polyacanthus TaxID=80966 RepID=A0A3Q1FAD1_9TELE